MWIAVTVGIAVVVAAALFVVVRRRRAGADFESVVMLRPSRRNLTETEVRGAARRALRADVELVTLPHPDGLTNCFAVVVAGTPALYVIDAGRAYVDDPREESNRFEHPVAREAFKSHGAWVSVDIPNQAMKAAGKENADMLRTMMCRVACELYDSGCTLLYAPALARVALPTPEIEAQLKEGNLSALFGDDEVNVPVIYTEGDGKVEKAVATAKREWPTFVEVWGRRGPSCEALVKGAFAHPEGQEHMWVEVTQVHNGKVTGTLINDPVHVVALKKGQTVTVNAPEDISDWACLDGEKPVGMFVERILRGG